MSSVNAPHGRAVVYGPTGRLAKAHPPFLLQAARTSYFLLADPLRLSLERPMTTGSFLNERLSTPSTGFVSGEAENQTASR